jgi:hypothetical protein
MASRARLSLPENLRSSIRDPAATQAHVVAGRPLQHPELVAEDEDLEVLRVLVALTEISDDDEANESPDDKVEERPHRPMVPRGPERESEFPTPTGSALRTSRPSEPRCSATSRRSLRRSFQQSLWRTSTAREAVGRRTSHPCHGAASSTHLVRACQREGMMADAVLCPPDDQDWILNWSTRPLRRRPLRRDPVR